AGRNHRASQRPRRGIEDEAAGRLMIAEGIEHHVAGPEARREQRTRPAPWVRMDRLGLEDRARRGEQPPERPQGPGHEPAEGWRGLVQGREFRLAQHWHARQCSPAGHGSGVDGLEALGIGRRGERLAPRRVFVQARQIYCYAKAAQMGWYPEGRAIALQGLEHLLAKAKAPDGKPGFVHTLKPNGTVLDPLRDSYDHAFVLLALA